MRNQCQGSSQTSYQQFATINVPAPQLSKNLHTLTALFQRLDTTKSYHDMLSFSAVSPTSGKDVQATEFSYENEILLIVSVSEIAISRLSGANLNRAKILQVGEFSSILEHFG